MKIRNKLLLNNTVFLLIILISGTITYFLVKNILQSYIDSELSNITNNSVNLVKIGINSSVKNHLKTIAGKGRQIAEYYYREAKSGKMSEQQAFQIVKRIFLNPSFGKIGTSGYLAGVSGRGILVIHPKAEGMDASSQEFMKQAMAMKKGYLEYMWKNPGESQERLKAAGLDYFEPWDLIIWASSYKDEFNSFVNPDDFKQEILSSRILKSGYVYILDKDGKSIVHPHLQGVDLRDAQDSKTVFFVQEMLRQKNGHIAYDWQNPDENKRREKIAYFKYIPEIDWLVVTTIYSDEISESLNNIKAIIFITLFLTSLLIIFLSIKLSSVLGRPIQNLIHSINEMKQGNLEIRANVETNDEIGELARNFNEMSAKIQYTDQELRLLNENLEVKVKERTFQFEEEKEKAEKARRETEVLAELARKVNETRDLVELLQPVAKILEERLGVDRLGLWVVDPDARVISLRSGFMNSNVKDISEYPSLIRDIPLAHESGIMYQTYRRRKSSFVYEVNEKWMARYPIDRAVCDTWQFDWFAHIPLLVDEKVIGILAFSSKVRREIPDSEKRFCERMADQVAGAVRAAELLRLTSEARREAERARSQSDRLLVNILPPQVAEELKREGKVEPLFYENASVLFTDFVGFTKASEKMTPQELVLELDGCFSQFDEVVKHNNMEKLKTIGDSYMCAAGIPVMSAMHAVDACLAALEFRSFMLQMQEIKRSLGLEFWEIRIGIHSGPVTAGVIGTNKFAYDIWGDTVNTASRMESSGEPGKINISQETYSRVQNFFDCEPRGEVLAKGKGKMNMYFLLHIKPELSVKEEGLIPNGKFEMMRL